MSVFLPLIVFFFILYFFLMRPQRKKEKQTQDMRNNLAVGDEVVTIGGIVGKVLSVKDDTIVLYCGSDKTKMEFKKWAIGDVTSKKAQPEKKQEVEDAPEEDTEAKSKFRKLSRKEETETDEADQ